MADGKPTEPSDLPAPEPAKIPEPPPYQPDLDLIGDMQRGEHPVDPEGH